MKLDCSLPVVVRGDESKSLNTGDVRIVAARRWGAIALPTFKDTVRTVI